MRHLLEEAFRNLMEAGEDIETKSLADKVMEDHKRLRDDSPHTSFYPDIYKKGCRDAAKYLTDPSVRKQLPPKFTQEHATETAKNIINRKKEIDEQLNRWNGQASSSNPHPHTNNIIKHLKAAKRFHEEGQHVCANAAWRTANDFIRKGSKP